MADFEKRTRGATRSVDQRLEEIRRKLARREKVQAKTGQKAFARARILTGLAALTTAEKDAEFARALAASIRSYCTGDRDLIAVSEVLENLDRMAGKS